MGGGGRNICRFHGHTKLCMCDACDSNRTTFFFCAFSLFAVDSYLVLQILSTSKQTTQKLVRGQLAIFPQT